MCRRASWVLAAVFIIDLAQADRCAVQDLQIVGNRRIDSQAILSYVPFKKGDKVEPGQLDLVLKTLLGTGLFKDVVLRWKGSILKVCVTENETLNRIVFEGNKVLDDNTLLAVSKLHPRETLEPRRVWDALDTIKDVYRMRGYFAAQISPELIRRSDSRVDLIFRVQEGGLSSVRNIFFVGNSSFSDGELKEILSTKETSFYRFFTTADTYHPARVRYDQEQLHRFYLENGYPDARIFPALVEMSPEGQDFFITFTVQEGEKYHLGKVDIKSDMSGLGLDSVRECISLDPGTTFNLRSIEEACGNIRALLSNQGFHSVDVRYEQKPNKESRAVDILLNIVSVPPTYVNKIHIKGNTVTCDHVIRRNLSFQEGSPFYLSDFTDSQRRLSRLGFLGPVQFQQARTAFPDSLDLIAKVEEISQGSLGLGGGYSDLEGFLADLSFMQPNLFGGGYLFNSAATWSQRSKRLLAALQDSCFLGFRGLSGGASLSYILQTPKGSDQGGHSKMAWGPAFNVGYRITEDLSHSWTYRFSVEEIARISKKGSPSSDMLQNALRLSKKEEGSYLISAIGHSFMYDKRNRAMHPTGGYYASFQQDFAGLGGDVSYLSHSLNMAYYYALNRDESCVFNLRGACGHIAQLFEKKVRVSDLFSMGGDNFLGFADFGVGPRDSRTQESLGGRQFYSGTAELLFPLGLPSDIGVKGFAFTQWGSLWNAMYSGEDVGSNQHVLRGSMGAGIALSTPIGPLRFSWSVPLKYVDGIDVPQCFKFSIGASF